MRGSWRVAKLKFNNKLASHTFMLSHDAEWILNKRSKSIARSRNGQGPKSMVIEDLLIEEKDINKKIKSEITKAKKDAVEKINNLKTTLDSISYKLKEKEEKIAEEERNNEILISTIEEINHLIMEVITHPNKALEDFEQNYEDGFTHILEKLPDNIKKKINKLKLF
ncbi:hypothetical protein SAMN05444390_101830 [Marinobacterium lutimaris]|uniref:Uncharacterized protein n=2 Tax=Marinobacterium lutimaris TaxID=568106 RepID=A0A1H5VSV0_9GAMM|nr:hypothetical protein SAMN05444390_101830 [Marinobacterium lutimaris]